MRRVAAVDCGTNTIKLLIIDLDASTGIEHEHVREMRMVRLGQDVDRTGRLDESALQRVFGAVDQYAALIAAHDVDAVRFCATSAARDASNAEVFAEGVRARLGTLPEIVPGHEEAQLSYDGATRGLADVKRPAPLLVIDIGGGSTELILGNPPSSPRGRGQVHFAASLDVGSVRMTERHLRSDPPSQSEVAAAVEDIDREIEATVVPLAQARTVVGVAGTVTTVAAGVLDLAAYDRAAINHSVLAYEDVHAMTARLLAMTRAERTALPYLHPGRADVIGAGALILDRVLHRTSAETLLVSEADILDGIAWSRA